MFRVNVCKWNLKRVKAWTRSSEHILTKQYKIKYICHLLFFHLLWLHIGHCPLITIQAWVYYTTVWSIKLIANINRMIYSNAFIHYQWERKMLLSPLNRSRIPDFYFFIIIIVLDGDKIYVHLAASKTSAGTFEYILQHLIQDYTCHIREFV